MGNDCEEHIGNTQWELDIRLNSAYTQGHLKATTHARLTWREKPPPSVSRTHNQMDWTTSGTHLITGYSLNAVLWKDSQEEAEIPASCVLCPWFCVCPWSLFCLRFWSWSCFRQRWVQTPPRSLPVWAVLWHSASNTTGPQVVTQPGKELQQLPLRLQTWLPTSGGFTIRWNISNRLKKRLKII